jgi:hypothetical protein
MTMTEATMENPLVERHTKMAEDRHITDGAVVYGPYGLFVSLFGNSRMMIQDAEASRIVAFVDSLAEWERFVAALEDGADEVAAVHAIDRRG